MRAALVVTLFWLMSASTPAGAIGTDYLYLPPIVGTASTPDYPGVIPIYILDLSPHELDFERNIDSTTPELYAANVRGTLFPVADIVFYENGFTEAPLIYQASDAVISQDFVIHNGAYGDEYYFILSFESLELLPPVPEPPAATLMLVGLLGATGFAAKRKAGARRLVDGRYAPLGTKPRALP